MRRVGSGGVGVGVKWGGAFSGERASVEEGEEEEKGACDGSGGGDKRG